MLFRDQSLLQQALVHRSYLNEDPEYALPSNERLEFLGDSVLGFVVADYLFHIFPDAGEGRLTNMRAYLVRTRTLSRAAQAIGLGQELVMGRGEEAGGGRSRPSILEASFEAMVGAIYLDQGIRAARSFVLRQLKADIAQLVKGAGLKDAKSTLQELTQKQRGITPTYHTVSAVGPDHDKWFTVEVRLGREVLAEGEGRTKQEAEQNAARTAIRAFQPSEGAT